MAIVKKTLQNLKPGKQYLLTVRAKDADLNNTLDPSAAIRFTVPTDQVEPTSLGNLQISVGYKTAMVSFNPADDLNLKNYEYKVYKESQVEQIGLHYEPISEDDYEIQGFSSSNVFTVNLEENSSIDSGTQVEDVESSSTTVSFIETKIFYFVKVRSITTSGVASSWTPLQKSGQIPFIPSAHIQNLSASQITSGYIGSETIVLTGADSILKSASYKPEKGDLRATLVAGSLNVTLTNGTTTAGLYPGMYFFISSADSILYPGRFGSGARVAQITDLTNFTATAPHSISGAAKFTSFAKGWNITGDGHVNFGGIQGIIFDGSKVRIGSDTVIDSGASLPTANIFSITSGTASLDISSTSTGIGLSINNVPSNVGNNYWYVDGSFKVGNATKSISYNATTGTFNVNGTVIQNGTVGGVSVSTNKVFLGTGTYANANTPFYVGREETDANTVNKFSLGNKLFWDGATLTIDGTVTIGSQTATTISAAVTTANNAATAATAAQTTANGKVNPADVLNHIGGTNVTTISGGKVTTGTISSVDSTCLINLDNGSINFRNKFIVDSFGNASFNGAITAASGTFSGALSGATGDVGGNFVVKGKLRVGESIDSNSGSIGTTVLRVQADGTTSTSRYPFVIEKSNGTNTFTIREDGRVDAAVSLYVAGTAVSVSGHGHSDYANVSGDTFTGTVKFDGAVYGSGIHAFTPVSTNRYTLMLSTTTGTTNTGNIYRIGTVPSSIRYKQDISKITFKAEDYFKLQTSTFRWKEHVQENSNANYDFGFIAEEARDLGLNDLWFADSDGVPEGIAYERVPLILWSIVSQQHKTIKDLYGRIEDLEQKVG
jgi:hypothetical protein